VPVLLLIGGIISLRFVGSAFFPKDLHNIFTVNVYLAEGTPIRCPCRPWWVVSLLEISYSLKVKHLGDLLPDLLEGRIAR
jgi:hypothetical protein